MMSKDERRIVEEAIEEVAPNIVYLSEFLERIRKDMEESGSIAEFLKKIEERISSATDMTRRTDFVIFRNELLRKLRI